jgi:hypothetical protein
LNINQRCCTSDLRPPYNNGVQHVDTYYDSGAYYPGGGDGYYNGTYYPAMPREVVPVAPFVGALWINGYWDVSRGHRRWVPGRYDRPGNRPNWNRPGDSRPNWSRPDEHRPGWNQPNRPGWNQPNRPSERPDWNPPGRPSERPGWNQPNRPGWNQPNRPSERPDWNPPGRPHDNRPDSARPGSNRPGWNQASPDARPNQVRPGERRPDANRAEDNNLHLPRQPGWQQQRNNGRDF